MNTVIIYNSKTGFTEKYAMWLKEGLKADCCTIKDAKSMNLDKYDAIIFGSWVCAGNVSKSKWFWDRFSSWNNKCLAVFAVGGSPRENPDIDKFLSTVIPAECTNAKAFYCQGGFAYEKMDGPSKFAMKLFVKMLKSRKNQTDDEKYMAEMISHSYDISDKKYILPIVEYVQGWTAN